MSEADLPDDEAAAETEAAQDEGEDEEGEPHLSATAADSATTDVPPESEDDEVEYVDLVKIHNVESRHEAKLLKGILEQASVPCMIEDDAADLLDAVSGAQLDGIDIFVPAEFAARAMAVLGEAGIACGLDKGRIDALYEEKVAPAAHAGGEAWATLAAMLEGEARDVRHELLVRLGVSGKNGLECARGLLGIALRAPAPAPAARDEGEEGEDEEGGAAASPLLSDIPLLAEEGRLGRDAPLIITGELTTAVRDPSALVRRRAASALGRLKGALAVPVLISVLADADAGVRDEALESLYRLSNGETFDFDPEADPATQEGAIVRWRDWAKRNPEA
jgi:hypothetical protein